MKVRKKPVVVEARQLTAESVWDIIQWCGSAGWKLTATNLVGEAAEVSYIEISTLEGTMRGNFGDWIIKGVKGEFYPCRADIFEETYEVIE